MNAIKIGEKLTHLRGKLPQDTVAKSVGISRSALSMYEQGKRIPRDEIKVKLARFYKSSVEEIFFTS